MIRQLPDLGTGVAFVLVLLVVTLSPLPFGSVLPRERLVLEVAGFAALAAVLLSRRDLEPWRGVAVPVAALAGVGLFGILQSLPYPSFLAAWLVPRGAAAWHASGELLGDAAFWVPLSLAPAVSRSVALLWLALAALMAAAYAAAPHRRLRRLLALGLLGTAIFEIVYGADLWFERRVDILGRSSAGGFDRLRGTFVNPDHFAMFLVIVLAAGFAWVWWSMRRASWLPLERRLVYLVVPWLFFVMVFVALAFTGSRAGFAGGLVTLLAQGLLLALRERRWQSSLLGLGAVTVGLGSLFYFGWQQGMRRWIATSAYEITWNTRFEVYRGSLELWKEFPWTGTGLGTFRQAFPSVQPSDLELTWFHAHSDVLELLVTTGLVGAALLAWGLAALLRRLWHSLLYGRRSEDRGMALAAWGALAGVLTHSLTDFGLTMPANAFLTVVVLGLACGVNTRSARSAAAQDAPTPAMETAAD